MPTNKQAIENPVEGNANHIPIVPDIFQAFPPDGRYPRRPESEEEQRPWDAQARRVPDYERSQLQGAKEGHASSWRSKPATGTVDPSAAPSRGNSVDGRDSESEYESSEIPPMPGTLPTPARRLSCSSDSVDESKVIDDCYLYYTEDTRGSSPWDAASPVPPPQAHIPTPIAIPTQTVESRFREDICSNSPSSSQIHDTRKWDVPESIHVSATQPVRRTDDRSRTTPSWVWVLSSAAVSLALSAFLAWLGAELYNGLAKEHLPVLQAVTVAAVTEFVSLAVGGTFFVVATVWRREKRRKASSVRRAMNLVAEMNNGEKGTRLQDDLAAQMICAVFLLIAVTALPLGMAASRKPAGFGPKEGILVNAVAIGVVCMACILPGLVSLLWICKKRSEN